MCVCVCMCVYLLGREKGVLGLRIACVHGHRHWVFDLVYYCQHQLLLGFVCVCVCVCVCVRVRACVSIQWV